MPESIMLTRVEAGENGSVYAPENASLTKLLGPWCVVGPGRTKDTLRLLDAVHWDAYEKLNRKLSIEDTMALRKQLMLATRPKLEGERLAITARLLALTPLGERCRMTPVEEGVWEISTAEEG